MTARELSLEIDGVELGGTLDRPPGARGLVLFAHGSGSSRHSPRNQAVAARLGEAGLATLLFDLLTPREHADRALVWDIGRLADRLTAATRLAASEADLPVGYFGGSTGAAAAIEAAVAMGERVRAVVSRGGRPDLAREALTALRAPLLLIVGGADQDVLDLNRRAAERLTCAHDLAVVDGATHLFEEPGALEQVADLAAEWFGRYLV